MLKKTTTSKRVRFRSNPRKDEFMKVLRQRVMAYFKDNNISQYANGEMYRKTVFAAVMWIGTYALIMSDILSGSAILLIAAFTLLGFVNVFIAFNIMHDACHDAYSADRKINKIMGYSMNFIGGNQYLFRKMHGAHHGFVNIYGIDVTLESHGAFRFTPEEPWLPKHKYQHFYTYGIYALAMLHWVLVKDFKWFFGELHIGNQKNIKHPKKEVYIMLAWKALYYTLSLVLPLIFLSAPVWVILVGFLMIHLLPGLYFALIFQCTHVYDGTTYPLPDEEGNIENNYAIHVLETTADFSRKSKIGSWLMGGINIHVIHHIFPNICHVHYPAITEILKDVAEEFELEYQENKTFWTAMVKHYKMLKHLSKPDATVPRIGKSAQYA